MTMTSSKSNDHIRERIARLKAEKAAALNQLKSITPDPKTEESPTETSNPSLVKVLEHLQGIDKPEIILNAEQSLAVQWAFEGKSFCLAGAAGTGKTTTTKQIISSLLERGTKPFQFSTKYITAGYPSIVVTAFTRRATKNAAEAIGNPQITAVNFHKLLQYEPVYYELENGKKTMRFEPKYNQTNKLPFIQTVLIDEASQFSIPMFQTLLEAMTRPEDTQFINIGDIQQIPPTMGTSIYGPKLIELPSVELTQVYRQALESPIIRFLTDMRSGKELTRNDWKRYTRLENGEPNNKMRMGVFPPKLDWEEALHQAASFLKQEFEDGIYNPYEDMVLTPFNVKKFGSEALNKAIAEMLDEKESRTLFPIVCGWQKKYYAVGDHVLYNTQDYVITKIESNPKYFGVDPDPPSKFIYRDGSVSDRKSYSEEQMVHGLSVDLTIPDNHEATGEIDHDSANSLVEFLQLQIAKGQEERTNSSSHIIHLQSLDDPEDPIIKLESVGDIANLSLSYAITVHKAQGLQAPRVYFFLHSSHSPMHYRELIYTAASRAKEYLTIICDPATMSKGITKQRIPGVTLEEKKLHFIKLLSDPSQEEEQ